MIPSILFSNDDIQNLFRKSNDDPAGNYQKAVRPLWRIMVF